MKALLLLSAVAATSVAPTLNAQAATGNRTFFRTDSAMAKRAALGLQLRPTGTRRDTLGVFVEAVTPKGPAENAGIVEGDRIAAINGVDLRTPAGDTDDAYVNGLAAHRLTREVQKLTPGNRVTLRVYSGGRFRDVQVTAGKASDVMRLGGRFNFRVPGPEGMMEFHGPGGAMMFGPGMPNGPGMQMLRQRLDMPKRIQIRTPMRIRTLAPTRAPGVFKVEAEGGDDYDGAMMLDGDFEDSMMLDMDDDLIDIEDEIGPVPPGVIRDLAANAIRDAQSALKQLAADGVA